MTQIPTENGLKCRKEKIENFYDIKEELGRGQFAVVKKCISKETNEEVAAKFIKLKRTRTSKAGLSREMIEREASILNLLSHDKVIKLYDVFDLGPEMVLVLELLSGGELFDKICELEYLTELDACCYMKQVLEAIEHLHDSSIVHLDIKPENIVLKSSDKTDIKLVDFGLAQKLEPGKDLREMMGTPEFVAPEVINYESIGFYTDMWAIGVLAYILLSGCSPFLGDDNQETYANIVEVDYHFDEEYFDKISDDAKLFVSELLIKKPSKRSTVKDCLTHPWLLTISGPRKRQDSSLIATGRFKAFVARRRWQQSFQKLNAITRFSKFLRKGVLPTFPEEHIATTATLTNPLTPISDINTYNPLRDNTNTNASVKTFRPASSVTPITSCEVELMKNILHSIKVKKDNKRKIKQYVPLDDDEESDEYTDEYSDESLSDSSSSGTEKKKKKYFASDVVSDEDKRIHGTLELLWQQKGRNRKRKIMRIKRQAILYASFSSEISEFELERESTFEGRPVSRKISIDDFHTPPEAFKSAVIINEKDFAPDFKYSHRNGQSNKDHPSDIIEEEENMVSITPTSSTSTSVSNVAHMNGDISSQSDNETSSKVEVFITNKKNKNRNTSSVEANSDVDSVFMDSVKSNFDTSTPKKPINTQVSSSSNLSITHDNSTTRSMSTNSAYEIVEIFDKFENMQIQTVEESGAVETEYLDFVNIRKVYETIDLEDHINDNDSSLTRTDSVCSQRSLTPRPFDVNDRSNNNPINKACKTYGGFVFDFDIIDSKSNGIVSSDKSDEINFNLYDDYIVIEIEKKKLTWNESNMSGLYIMVNN